MSLDHVIVCDACEDLEWCPDKRGYFRTAPADDLELFAEFFRKHTGCNNPNGLRIVLEEPGPPQVYWDKMFDRHGDNE